MRVIAASQRSGNVINLSKVRTGNLTDKELLLYEKFGDYDIGNEYYSSSFSTGGDINKILQQIRATYARRKTTTLVFDYGQQMNIPGFRGNKSDEYGLCVKDLKDIATKYNMVIILPVQLNRDAAEGKAGSHHIKGSGDFEQTADTVMILDTDKTDDDEEINDGRTIYVTKSRYGKRGSVDIDTDLTKGLFFIKDIDRKFPQDKGSKE